MTDRKQPAPRPAPTDHEIELEEAAIIARIKSRREVKKLSQAEAARRAGWSPSTWADLERGRYAPNLKTLLRIAHALDCTAAHLCRI